MSGRPAAPTITPPSYVVPTFATDADYPAGADEWSAQPLRVVPASMTGGFVPNEGASAEEVNYVFGVSLEATQAAEDFQTANATEVTSDFAALYNFAGQIPALNFSTAFDAKTRTFAKYNAVTREWFALSLFTNDDIRVTKSIELWPSATSIPAPQHATLKPWDLDFNTAGDMMAVADAVNTTWTRTAGGTWVHLNNIPVDPVKPNLVFEPVSGNWILAAGNSPALYVMTSTNFGTSWTTQTVPTFPTTSTVTMASDGAGNVVMQGFLGTNCYFSLSSDGGVTWSAPVTVALGFTWSAGTYHQPKPVWTGSHWVAIASDLTGHTMVFSSNDGLTWTTVSLATAFTCLQCAGELVVIAEMQNGAGPHAVGGFAISLDGGATFQWTDYTLPATTEGAVWIAWNGVRFAVYRSGNFSNGTVYPGPGIGTGVGAVT